MAALKQINQRPSRGRIILACLAVAVMLMLGLSGNLGALGNSVRGLFNPAGAFLTKTGRNLQTRPQSSEDLAALREQAAKADSLEQENADLRAQLNFPERKNFNYLGADVLSQQVNSQRRTLTLNRGSNSGVKLGQPILSEGHLIGIINSLETERASALLLSDPAFRATVTVGDKKVSGIVKGQIGGAIVDRLPVTDLIQPGEIVRSSSLGGELPNGLVLGTAGDRRDSEDGVFYQLQLVSPVTPENLRSVLIVVE